MTGAPVRMPMTTQRAQLNRQAWLHELPRDRSQQGRSPTLLAATIKPAASTDAVRAEFIEAGIPDEIITETLKQYEVYLRWDLDTKLRPALQLWIEHLGSQQLSERLDKYPRLLLHLPEESIDVYLWLADKGVDVDRIQQKAPQVMARDLKEVQNTVWAIQQALELTDEQLPAFFERHFYSLLFSPEHVARILHTVAELLALPVASKKMQEVIMVCGQRLFKHDPAVVHHRVSFFCKEFKGGQHAAEAALRRNVYQMTTNTMKAHSAELKVMLGWTEDELHRSLNSVPQILGQKPSTVANNIQKFQKHNFTSTQALEIYASAPSLAGYDWSSPSNLEKLMYLSLVLQVSTTELVSMYRLLVASLVSATGPRSEFLYRSRAIPCDVPLRQSKLSSYIVSGSDARFAARFNKPSASPPLMYDEEFKQHWQQRWTFLRHEMGLSVADISACRAVLFTSLPNTLAPRWQFLTMLEAVQAGFKAADHLTALATLSDEHFAQVYNVTNVNLVYDKKFRQLHEDTSLSRFGFCS